jgi:RHS repeat-associated protein
MQSRFVRGLWLLSLLFGLLFISPSVFAQINNCNPPNLTASSPPCHLPLNIWYVPTSLTVTATASVQEAEYVSYQDFLVNSAYPGYLCTNPNGQYWGPCYPLPATPYPTPPYYTVEIGTSNPEHSPLSGGLIYEQATCPKGEMLIANTATWDYPNLMCQDNTVVNGNSSANAIESSNLQAKVGQGNSPDPIDLVTQNVKGYEVDYKNQSPLPIVWSRTYVGTKNEWVFNYQRSVTLTIISSTSAVLTLNRQDGQTIEMTGTLTNSAWVWTPPVNTATTASIFLGTVTTDSALTTAYVVNMDDQTETYNLSTGTLTKIQDLKGNYLNFSYNNDNFLTQITDNTGRYLTISGNTTGQQTGQVFSGQYDANHNPIYNSYVYYSTTNEQLASQLPSSITDGTSTISYTYGFLGTSTAPIITLSTVTQADGTVLTYNYNSNGQWTGTVDQSGNSYQTYNYRTSGTVTSMWQGNQVGEWQFTNNVITYPNGTTSTVIGNSNGQVTSSSRPCLGCSIPYAKTIVYDAYGDPITLTDFAGNVESITYNTSRSLPLTVTDAYGTSLAQTTKYQWDSRFRQPDQIVTPVQTPTGAGTLTTVLNYDNSGNVLSWTKTVNGPSGYQSVRSGSATYNAFGENLTTTDANGNVTTFVYDNLGDLTSVKNALGQTTTMGGYDSSGVIGWIQDPNGLTTTFSYNPKKQINQISKGCSGCVAQNYNFQYTPFGEVSQITIPNGTGIAYKYDAAHRVNEKDVLNSSGGLLGKVLLTLDAGGTVTGTSYQNASGTVIQVQTFQTDDLDRIKTFVDQENHSFTTVRDDQNRIDSVTDPLGNGETYQYDALNRIVKATATDNTYTSVGYGAGSEIVTQTDPRGLSTSYSYDGFGNVVTRNSPDSGTTTYTYDSNDNVLSRTDARGTTVNIAYDGLNRETSETGSVSGEVKQFTYDTCTNGIGRLCSVVDRTGTTTFTYDPYGHVTQKQEVMNGLTFTLGYSYDNYGELSSITYPSGQAVSYSYLNGNIQSISTSSTNILNNVTYDPFDRLLGWTWNNGRQVSYTYDMDGRLSNILTGTTTMAYTRDNAWKIAGLNEVNPTLSMSYGYDSRNRLTTSNIWGTYAYDANSNRTSYLGSLGPLAYTYGTTNNQLLTYNSSNVSVDAMGNITSKNGLMLTYDDWGRMRTSNNGNGTYTYGVNGLDERVSKTNGANNYYYIYAGIGQLIGIYNSSGLAVDEMVYLGNTPVSSMRSGIIYNIETDNLGTPVRVLDQNNNIDWSWEGKEPFGLSQPTSSVVNGSNFIFNLRFPGQYADQETGLFQNGYREYDPTTGRYMEVDPLGLSTGWNPYNYVDSNPLNEVDSLGLWAITIQRYGIGWGWIGGGFVLTGEKLNIKSFSFKLGLGKGSGFSINPWGSSPVERASCGSNSLGYFGEIELGRGFVSIGTSTNGGITLTPQTHFSTYNGKENEYSVGSSSGAFKFSLLRFEYESEISAGIELTHTFRN